MNRRLFFGSMVAATGALTLKPEVEPFREGDVLMIESEEYLSQQGLANLTAAITAVLPEGMKVLVLDRGLSARLLRTEAAGTLTKA
jgi:hypothetical protein